MNENYHKWDELAPRGMLLIGFGVSLIGHAIFQRIKSKGFLWWSITGLVGLIVLNSGIALFGEAMKHRTLYEVEVQKLREEE